MASTVLPNGIIIPEKYSRDWYNDLYHNWQELDNLLGGGTPKDGTLTIQKNGSTVGTFSANQATNETINIEVPAVNDATLTIQQNGTTVDTFTANSSTDKTVDITVPTKTSDLTNDSGFITSDNTKIPLAGSNAISGDLIPSTNGTVNLGGSNYQWNQAYIKSLTINGVACGDILTHNASEFVNVTGAQTIGGVKTFSNEVTMFGRDINLMSRLHYGKNSNPSSASWQYLFFQGNTASEGYTGSWYSGYLEQFLSANGSTRGRWLIRDTSENAVCIELSVNGSDKQVKPSENNAVELGTSTNKWKSFNGINPGALSLSSVSYVNIDTSQWDITMSNNTLGGFIPEFDGWVLLQLKPINADTDIWIIGGTLRTNYKTTVNPSDNTKFIMCYFPVLKGYTYNIYGHNTFPLSQVSFARLFPCQGNV